MKRIPQALVLLIGTTALITACERYGPVKQQRAQAASDAPFGTEADIRFASTLWTHLRQARLVGEDAIHATPYAGVHPHGAILETFDTTLAIDGKRGEVVVKRNYGGEGVSKEAVANSPANYLQAITVMYRRPGYDPENQDWFWVKYDPNGTPMTNPKGMRLAGRVAKGASEGCIACHKAAPGNDYLFIHDRLGKR